MHDLRTVLRTQTAQSHQNLDSQLVNYDLTEPNGLSQYLAVHYLARSLLTDIMPSKADLLLNLKKIEDIQEDFEVLKLKPPAVRIQLEHKFSHPLGLTYVMAGSSLGSKVLYKQWASSTNPTVKRAGKFITNSKDSSEWKIFLSRLEGLALDAGETEDVIQTANHVFDIYIAANEHVKLEQR